MIVTGQCCRIWPLIQPARIGRCGYCGEIPSVVDDRPPWDRTGVEDGTPSEDE